LRIAHNTDEGEEILGIGCGISASQTNTPHSAAKILPTKEGGIAEWQDKRSEDIDNFVVP
jgi:hypothetical protein